MKESDLYLPVTELFPDGEIFPEVIVGDCRPDITIRQGNIITIVELKTSLSLALIEQAYGWVGCCNKVYVGIPKPKKVNNFAIQLLRQKGIGVILVKNGRAEVYTLASHADKCRLDWSKLLHDFYKENEAGGICGEYVTPYKHMINCVEDYLTTYQKPITARNLVEVLDKKYNRIASEHYANPVSSLYKALSEYESSWCEKQIIDGKAYFTYIKSVLK